jgi:hypothetical protein
MYRLPSPSNCEASRRVENGIDGRPASPRDYQPLDARRSSLFEGRTSSSESVTPRQPPIEPQRHTERRACCSDALMRLAPERTLLLRTDEFPVEAQSQWMQSISSSGKELDHDHRLDH